MIDPYRMVFINIIAFSLVLLGIFFYKFIFPKKRINLLSLLIIISILPCLSLLRIGAYESGDFNIHVYRSIDFYRSLSEGNIFPVWAGDLNATYGYPLFMFNYTLPYYLISFFHYLGFSFIASMKIFIALSFILSGIFMYNLANKIFKNELAAFVASIFYLFAPYHLIAMHFKVVIGEILSFTLTPLLFYFMLELYEKKKINYFLAASIAYALLIMSHIVIALFVTIIIVFYIALLTVRKTPLKISYRIIFSFILGLLMTTYVWLTPFFMNQYTFLYNLKKELLPFPSFLSLLYSPWRFGFLFQGNKGEISNLIGYTAIFVVIFSFFQIIKGKVSKKTVINQKFWLITFFVLIFLLTPFSTFFWMSVPFLGYVGQHRLLIVVAFTFSIIAGYFVINNIKRKNFIYILIFLTIASTILNWGHRRVIPEITDATLIDNLPMSTYQGEAHYYANSKWIDTKNPWFSKIPANHIEIINGNGTITNVNRTSTTHIYNVSAKTNLTIKENTLYFPGWRALAGNNFIKLHPDNKGIISATLPSGNYKLYIIYENIFKYQNLLTLSFITFLVAASLLSFNILRKNIRWS